MNKKGATIQKESRANQGCRHYWIIKTAAGPVSHGVCKFCGAKRKFGNHLPNCLGIEKEDYLQWAESPKRYKGDREPTKNIFAGSQGGDRDAVEAVA